MKRTLIICLLTCLFIEAKAQQSFTNLEKAKSYASQNHKTILLVFAGSDWCRPCIQFKKEVLENLDFGKYAKDKLAIVYLDFPARKKNKLSEEQTKYNEKLSAKYNPEGAFPKILLISKTEEVLGELHFRNQGVQNFIQDLEKISK